MILIVVVVVAVMVGLLLYVVDVDVHADYGAKVGNACVAQERIG